MSRGNRSARGSRGNAGGPGGTRTGAGRPSKYATLDEYLAVRRERDRIRRAGRKRELATIEIETPETPPPIEVVLERRHRDELRKQHRAYELPPPSYAANYYVKAWRIQRRIARGQSV